MADIQSGAADFGTGWVCYNCRGVGHKQRDCPKPCRKCKDPGHQYCDCPLRPANIIAAAAALAAAAAAAVEEVEATSGALLLLSSFSRFSFCLCLAVPSVLSMFCLCLQVEESVPLSLEVMKACPAQGFREAWSRDQQSVKA